MDYKELLEQQEWNSPDEVCDWMNRAEEAIRELVSRCKILETRLETAEKMVKEYQDVIVPGYRERAENAEIELDNAKKLIDWIYSEACISVEHDMRQHLDWLKEKIEKWRGAKEE